MNKELRSLIGKVSKKQGLTNENLSINYILENPDKYGITEYQTTKAGLKYNKERIYKAPKVTWLGDIFELWDIITIPSDDEILKICEEAISGVSHKINYIYLVQVKSSKPSLEYIRKLINYQVPFYVRKELHIWKNKELQIIEL